VWKFKKVQNTVVFLNCLLAYFSWGQTHIKKPTKKAAEVDE
jgi:hypothetical protein